MGITSEYKVTVRKMVSETKWETKKETIRNTDLDMMAWFRMEVQAYLTTRSEIYSPYMEPIIITAFEIYGCNEKKIWAQFKIS